MSKLDFNWACPDCSFDENGYVTDYVKLDYRKGEWTCPECGCSTFSPTDDICLQMDDVYALYSNVNYHNVVIYHFENEQEFNDYIAPDDSDWEMLVRIPASMASVLVDKYNMPEIDY